MRIDRGNFVAQHFRWVALVLVVTALAIAWYVGEARYAERWPGGGSRVGITLGLLAGAIFLFEAALPLRRTRWLRTSRLAGNARLWMKAHLWLGLLTVPLVVLHSGFRTGGTFTTSFVWIFTAVIASGVLGLVLQNVVPRIMLEWVPEETIFSQIPVVSRQMVEEAERLVGMSTAGESDAASHPAGPQRSREGDRTWDQKRVTVGAQRRVGRPIQRTPAGLPMGASTDSLTVLQHAFQAEVGLFLATGRSNSGKLARQRTSDLFFHALRQNVDAAGVLVVDQLETMCGKRRNFNLQSKLHWVLHGWLLVHLPLSVLLLVMLGVHIVYALRFG